MLILAFRRRCVDIGRALSINRGETGTMEYLGGGVGKGGIIIQHPPASPAVICTNIYVNRFRQHVVVLHAQMNVFFVISSISFVFCRSLFC